VLIWRFGIPATNRRGGASYLMLQGTDENEKKRETRYDRRSRVGLGLLVAGFLLQLLSNFL